MPVKRNSVKTYGKSPSSSSSKKKLPSPATMAKTGRKPKEGGKSRSEDSLTPPPPVLFPSPKLDKDLTLNFIILLLENMKNIDWFSIAKQVETPLISSNNGGKGRNGKSKKEDEKLSGNELRDLFNNTILPSLKNGNLPWSVTNANTSSPSLEGDKSTSIATP
ncbi:uncharacterized protein IL334_004017 [Kwoniella shivajii]|uniref:ASX DEUBAD domain-containing protein n=1 Tax=Kwoniella shivajii TaxID=564305 RepID=A0ABZ1CZK5_9TREE|nr:hypothetical protein IL334_004017 [Kwoniella shivajii]